MIQALLLKYVFGAKIKVVFSSAAQRYRSGFTLWLTKRMDAVLAMCNASASYLQNPPNAVIYHGIQTNDYLPPEDKVQAWQQVEFSGKPTSCAKYGIAILGRVRKQKGVHLFVEACIDVLQQYPDYTAVVVGAISSSNKDFVTQLQNKVAAANMSDRIVFAGEQKFSDIPKIFSSLSLVAALSENEGFGLTILEAMSSEAAVLATEAGAWPEVIRQGVDGYVVPVNDVEAVKQKLALMLSNPTKLIEMGKAGRQRVLENYAVEREAKQLYEFFKTLQ
jgi:mannosyltransferase